MKKLSFFVILTALLSGGWATVLYGASYQVPTYTPPSVSTPSKGIPSQQSDNKKIFDFPGAKEPLDDIKSPRNDKTVFMYRSQNCAACDNAEAYFKSENITYRAVDVRRDRETLINFFRFGGGQLPLIFIDSQRLNGFSIQRFESIYGS